MFAKSRIAILAVVALVALVAAIVSMQLHGPSPSLALTDGQAELTVEFPGISGAVVQVFTDDGVAGTVGSFIDGVGPQNDSASLSVPHGTYDVEVIKSSEHKVIDSVDCTGSFAQVEFTCVGNPYTLTCGFIFGDTFEERTTGTLAPDYAVLSGDVQVVSTTQKDATIGNVLRLFSEDTVELTAAGNRSDFRFEFDFKGGAWDHVVAFRATDVDNGYQFVFNNASVSLYQVSGGNRTFLVRGNTLRSSSNWERYTIEAVGDEIRVTDNEALLMRVTDDTYFSGKTFISAFVNALTLIDNIEMESITAITRSPAATTVWPFETGFDDLVLRDGVLQHPNIDLLEGSQGFINHPARPEKDGTQGNILRLLGRGGPNPRSTVGLTGLEDQSDFRLEFDFKGGAWDHVVAFRASDLDNGYELVLNNTNVKLYSVVGGTRGAALASGGTSGAGNAWARYTIEAVGNEITITDRQSLSMQATDATHASGGILFSSFQNAITLIDNLLI